jgi:hypothetical protein
MTPQVRDDVALSICHPVNAGNRFELLIVWILESA